MSDEKTQRQEEIAILSRVMGTEFVRHGTSDRVEVIHRWSCPHVLRIKYPVGWRWAEGRDPSEWLSHPWFRPCKTCCADLQPKEAA